MGELRAIVRDELAKAPTVHDPVRPGWMTPPKAAKALEVPLKRVRMVIAAGRAKTRPCSPYDKNCRRHEVHLESLKAALDGEVPAPPIDLAQVRYGRK